MNGTEDKLEFNTVSFALNKLVAGSVLLISSLIGYIKYGANLFTERTGENGWLFLGGPSLFYPVAIFCVPFGLAFVIYSFLTFGKYRFRYLRTTISSGSDAVRLINKEEVGTSESMFIISYFGLPFFSRRNINIPINSVKYLFADGRWVGTEKWILIPAALHIWYLSIDAFRFIFNPLAFGAGPDTGYYYATAALLDTVALTIIFGGAPVTLRIFYGNNNVFDTQIYIPGKTVRKKLFVFLGNISEIRQFDRILGGYRRRYVSSYIIIELLMWFITISVAFICRLFYFSAEFVCISAFIAGLAGITDLLTVGRRIYVKEDAALIQFDRRPFFGKGAAFLFYGPFVRLALIIVISLGTLSALFTIPGIFIGNASIFDLISGLLPAIPSLIFMIIGYGRYLSIRSPQNIQKREGIVSRLFSEEHFYPFNPPIRFIMIKEKFDKSEAIGINFITAIRR